jgi:hypothetical protein
LRNELRRGKTYADRWQKWEDDQKKAKDGEAQTGANGAEAKSEAETEAKPPAAGTPPAGKDAVSGHWEGELAGSPLPRPIPISMDLKLAGDQVTGTIGVSMGRGGATPAAVTGKLSGTKLTLTAEGQRPMTLEADLTGDEMTGTVGLGPMQIPFTARRTESGAAAPAAPSGQPAPAGGKPAVDQALEPYRALFAGQIPAVVRTDKALAIRDVIKVFRDEFKLPLILVGADDAVKSPELVTGHVLGIQLGA